MQHVAIRQESYVAGSSLVPEVGVFTQTHTSRHPVPWGRIAVGDVVWMKWTGGPIVARARVRGFQQIEDCTPGQLRATVVGFKLHDLMQYWDDLEAKNRFFALTVYLEEQRWLTMPIVPSLRSRGENWIVLDTPAAEAGWLNQAAAPPEPDERTGRGSRTISLSLRFQHTHRLRGLTRNRFICGAPI